MVLSEADADHSKELSALRQDAADALRVAINLTHHARHDVPMDGQAFADGQADIARVGYVTAVARYTLACSTKPR